MNSNMSSGRYDARFKRTRRIVAWLAAAILVLLVAYLGIGAYAASTVTMVGEHPQYDETPATYGLEYQDVRFAARGDDTEIAAWYIPNEGSASAVILVHGRDASKQNALSGEFPKLGAALHGAGHAVLMIDLRGHGDSEGVRYSFGVYERRDVLGAVDWLLAAGFGPGRIGVLGISLGGGATIGATAEEPAIGALVVESTFADMRPLIRAKWQEESGLPDFFLPALYLMNRLMYGYDLPSIRPVEEIVSIAPRPILIIHCATDEDVPPWHAEQLMEAVPHAESWVTGGCEHAEIYRDHPHEYEDRLISFLENLR